MMAQIAANATSTALGVAAGRAIDRTFFGGGSAPAAEGDTQDAEEAAPQQYASAGAPKAANGGACSFESSEFSKCLETSDASACQWYFDLLSQCQQNAKENAQYAQH
ncbi:Coiled-coil-helix-coiled-coil-helix domain-containing protein 10, mitochondrial [Porphyridium purpureum]|uniref:Coiled-coil-helix-coiled-coil-helix domain-containing protein 10, mitochondrial n=1 Tax=Porphyridium purpureum TaxID=35688 RepID=A0A5J4Z6V0_PORPP|nr:Coiled-coil-helix-coiled-coil-helix domain-containing protein 10, mitochondrial [Porphyridium purpureum]|eukprot:POR2919..scf295_1